MKTQYYEKSRMMISGSDNVSDHLKWLTLAMINMTTEAGSVVHVAFNTNLPKNVWGCFHGSVKAMAVNLEEHFESARNKVQDEAKNTNIKLVLLQDLMDTVAHEAYHAKKCAEIKDFAKSDLDEEGAKTWARRIAWELAKDYDYEVKSFGPILDTLIEEFKETLIEDTKESDCKEWKHLQMYLLNNNLAYYDEEGTSITTFREAAQIATNPKEPWTDQYQQFLTEVKPNGQENTTVEPQTNQNILPQDYSPLDDIYFDECVDNNPPVEYTPKQEAIPPAQPAANAPSVIDLQRAAEMVMRRLFHHVYTKCQPTNMGTFMQPEAVLEPVPIQDIPFANTLFIAQQTINEMGTFIPKETITNGIKGLVTKGGLPRYTLYMNIGGNEVKRTFIPQNPTKTKADGTLTAWAQRVQAGDKIMMLLGDNGPTADVQLSNEQPLGQEKVTIWAHK